jgi:hypothetical protein
LVGAPLKYLPTTLAGDSHLTGRRPAAIVMRHSAGNAAEFAERLFAATMARTDLSHILLEALIKKFNKTFQRHNYQLVMRK